MPKPPLCQNLPTSMKTLPFKIFSRSLKTIFLINRDDLIPHSWLYHGQELDEPDTFTMSYTIPRRITDQIAINGERDFKQMVEEATKKDNAEIKVYIIEQKVCVDSGLSNLEYMTHRLQNEDEPDEDLEHEEAAGPAHKKKKVHNFLLHYLFVSRHYCRISHPERNWNRQK
jgi:hypothetical protein